MSDIRFNLSYMSTVTGDCIRAENGLKSSISAMQGLVSKAESELSSFSGAAAKTERDIQAAIYEIRDLMSELERKAADAEKQRQKEISIPSRPSLPQNATPAQKNAIVSAYNDSVREIEKQNASIREKNQEIDGYALKCSEAKGLLEAEIAALHQIKETVKSEIEPTVSRVHEFLGQAHGINNQLPRVAAAMCEFTAAFKEAYQSAEKLYMMEPSSITAHSYNDKQFVIKNTHSHILGSGGASFVYSSEKTDTAEIEKKKTKSGSDELLIREKDAEAFFAKITGEDAIKIPSANFHRLGGKKFVKEMNARGYSLLTLSDGSTIDTDGMMHWVKNDD